MKMQDFLKKLYSEEIDVPENFSDKIIRKIKRKKEKRKYFQLKPALSFLFLLAVGSFFFFQNPFSSRLLPDETMASISYEGSPDQKVFVMGDFNNWEKQKLEYKDGKWVLDLVVKMKVIYHYTLVVDDEVVEDKNSLGAKDYFGNKNSVLVVFK